MFGGKLKIKNSKFWEVKKSKKTGRKNVQKS